MTFWIIAFLVLLIAEIISLGLTTIWFAGGALVAGVLAFLGAGSVVQFVAFAVVSLVLLLTTRPIAMKHFSNDNMERTNVEALIGKAAMVTATIDNDKSQGQVKISGMEWTARSKDGQIIPKDTKVNVLEVSGVKLIVEPCNKGDEA